LIKVRDGITAFCVSRKLQFYHNIGVFERVGADGGAGRGELRIRQARLDARPRLDRDVDAQRLEFLHGVGRSRDPRLGGIDFLGDGNLHLHIHASMPGTFMPTVPQFDFRRLV
jgi:hypothetical protein